MCPWWTGNPQAIEPICSGCNTDCAYCGCARAQASVAGQGGPAVCGQCPIRCGSRVDIAAWMADVGGTLTFTGLKLDGLAWPGLPAFVPQVDQTDLGRLDAAAGWSAYAIGLRRVVSPATGRVLPGWRSGSAAEVLGLDRGQKTVLVGYGRDPLVEAFWTRRHQLVGELARMAWDVVLAPNYSMYGNYPRAEMLLNFRRNLQIAAEMCTAGLPAVPNLYWFRLEDLERYATWAADAVPAAVAVNLQTFRTDADWHTMALPGLAWLADALPASTRVVAVGASRTQRITALAGLFGERLTLIAQNALAYARHGAVMTADGRRDVHAHVADAFAANVAFYAGLLAPHSRQRPRGGRTDG